MVRMICLANSIRRGDRCVAGIDVKTGRWVRPVPPGGGGLPEERVHIGGRLLQPLDVIDLNVEPPHLGTKFQRENCVMPAYDWKIVGRARPEQLLRCCDATVPILHTMTDRVPPVQLERLAPAQWKSLQLVRATNVRFERDEWNAKRWRADFKVANGRRYSLKITDPPTCDRLDRGQRIKPDCLLTVSLTEPWPTDGSQQALCYKLVAAVIEV